MKNIKKSFLTLSLMHAIIIGSEHNDTLRIIDYAYNNIENSQITAGQKE